MDLQRLIFIVAIPLLLPGCCPCKGPNCPDNAIHCDTGGLNALIATPADFVQKLHDVGEIMSTNPAMNSALEKRSCCETWKSEVIQFCMAQIDQYCGQSCSDDPSKEACRTNNEYRTPLFKQCYAEQWPEFHAEVKDSEGKIYCEEVALKDDGAVWRTAGQADQSCP